MQITKEIALAKLKVSREFELSIIVSHNGEFEPCVENIMESCGIDKTMGIAYLISAEDRPRVISILEAMCE